MVIVVMVKIAECQPQKCVG